MADGSVGRAVLELGTDDKKLDAGLAGVPAKVGKVGDSVKNLAGPLSQVNGLLGTFGASLSIGAVVSFGNSLLDMADQIVKVHDRTGLTTDEVQRLQFIAEQSGNSLDDLTGAVSKLQIRLADGKGRKGIEELGLNFEKIRNMRPADALAAIASEIGKIENPTLRAKAAVDVFGKAGAEILPTLVANFKELGDAAPVASEDTILALDAAGDALSKFGSSLKVWAAESYNYARGFFDKLIAEAYRMVQRLYENAAALVSLAAKLPGAERLGINQKLVDSLKESAVWYANVAKAMDTNTTAAKKNAPAVAALPPINEAGAKAAKAHADAIASLTERLSGAGAIKAARDMEEALRKLPPIQNLTKDAQIQIAETMEKAIAVYAAAGKSIPLDLQLIAMAARASSKTMSDAARASMEAMQKAWSQTGGIKLNAIPIAFGFEDPTWATRTSLKATQSFAAAVAQIDVVKVQAVAAKRLAQAFGGSFWKDTFGSAANFGVNFGNAIMGAIQGGGNIFNAAGGFIGQEIGKSVATKIGASLAKEGAGVLSKAMGGLLEAVLPGVGALLGPLLEKVWGGIKKLFGGGNDGRELVKQFAAGMGGFDELQKKLVALGPEYERLWRGLTQLKSNASRAEAQAAIDAVTEALARQEAQVKENTAASEQGAADMAAAQKEAADAIRARYAEAFEAIDSEYKKLNDSVAAEAEEADMGAQERLDRARMAELEIQRAALEQQQQEEIAAKDETFAAVLTKAETVDQALRELFGRTLVIPYEFVGRNTPGTPPVEPMAEGGVGRVTGPTLFYSGGNEDFAFSGEGRSFGLGALGSRPIDVTTNLVVDGRVMARNQARHLPNELERVGVRSR